MSSNQRKDSSVRNNLACAGKFVNERPELTLSACLVLFSKLMELLQVIQYRAVSLSLGGLLLL